METKLNLIIPLLNAHAELPLAGGKGASLAKLARARPPVPPGFRIATAAYRWFVAEHCAIVAREHGIPAVMATGMTTRRIHTGQMITMDGGAGTVEI
jgi:pyruvate,water dikinase